MIAMVYDHSHPTELHVSMCNGHPQENSPPVLNAHRFDLRLPSQAFFLIEFNENCLEGWKEI